MATANVVRVLIVEDQPTDAEILRRSLSRLEVENLEATFASTAREAKALLAKTKFDLLLLDLHLPDVVGYELIHEAKRLQKTLPVVVVTSLNDSDAALEVGRIGADDYIVKDDLMGSSLGRTIRRLLRARLQSVAASGSNTRLIEEPSDRIETWLAWRFPTDQVPPGPLKPAIHKETKTRYQSLLTVSLLKDETKLRQAIQDFEDFAYAQRIPAEELIAIHREIAPPKSGQDAIAGRQRFVLFELLAALLEKYSSNSESSAEA